MEYVIETPKGFVAGYNARLFVVAHAATLEHAKKFKTEKAARAFVAKYADCGFGLVGGAGLNIKKVGE